MFLTYEENIPSCKKKVSEENGIGSYVSWITRIRNVLGKVYVGWPIFLIFWWQERVVLSFLCFYLYSALKKYKYLQNDSFARMMAQINSTLRIFIAVYRWFTIAFIRFIRRKKGLLKYIMVYQRFTMVYQHFWGENFNEENDIIKAHFSGGRDH